MRKVVVTGIGAVTALGNDVPTIWQNLINGVNGIGPITRFDTTDHKSNLAAEVKNFDPLAFMERSEVRKTDLFTQYAVAAASEAIADSDIIGTVAPDRFGVYLGSGVGGINAMAQEQTRMLQSGPRRISAFFVPMMISNIAAGTLAIRYGAKGPCILITTACASSTNAIGEGLRAIRHGYADACIVGGAEGAIMPVSIAGFANMMALSTSNDPDAASLPFDKRREGFVMGDGAGILIIEEYQHAVDRGAKIYGFLSGYGSTCDASHITAPDPSAESSARAIHDAFAEAGSPMEGGIYINAHGTGTQLNDVTETFAIKKGLGEKLAYKAMISSTKSMIGHLLGAAGAVEAVFAILALKHGIIPPTINLKESDPECDLDYVPLKARIADISTALSISLGFGGHNACLAFSKYSE